MKPFLPILALTLVCAACESTPEGDALRTDTTAQAIETPAVSDSTMSVSGTIRYTELEGGGWLLVGDDSTRYQPINLDPEFQESGLAVQATLRPRPDMMSTLMSGQIVEIVEMTRR